MRVPRHVISRALSFFYQHIYCTLRLFSSPTSLSLIVVISVLGHYHIILGSHLAYGHASSWSDTDRFAKSIYNRPQLKRFHSGLFVYGIASHHIILCTCSPRSLYRTVVRPGGIRSKENATWIRKRADDRFVDRTRFSRF